MRRRGLVAASLTGTVLIAGACSTEAGVVVAELPAPPTTTAAPSTAAPTTSAPPTTPAPTTIAPTTTAVTTTTVPVAPPPPLAQVQAQALRLEPFVDVPQLTGFAWRAGDAGLYVSSQTGQVRRIVDGVVQPGLVLDLGGEVSQVLEGSEQGLLGIAFDPVDGRMFLDYTDRAGGHTHVVSFEVRDGVAVLESRREVLVQEQPGPGHNGGHLAFDRTGQLYVSLGDGGGSNGRDAQDMTKILGAIIRITPDRHGPGYAVPPDNPFVGVEGVRPEIWVKGLRNPWRFSIDHATGNLWLGDVGNDKVEEVDVVPAGQKGLNFGWYFYEGTTQRYRQVPQGMTPPVYEYPHSVGPAVMGGYVYRGRAIPALAGAYLFADLSGIVFALTADGVTPLAVRAEGAVTGWGEGPDGELYVMTLRRGLLRLVAG